MIRGLALAVALLGAGCFIPVTVSHEPDASTNGNDSGAPDGSSDASTADFLISGVACVPDLAAEGIERGRIVECTYQVQGDPGGQIHPRCQNSLGVETPCQELGVRVELPEPPLLDGARPGWLSVDTALLAPGPGLASFTLMLTRSSGDPAEAGLSMQVVPNDFEDEPSILHVFCGGATVDTAVTAVGETLYCEVRVDDPDPPAQADLRFKVEWLGHPPLGFFQSGRAIEFWSFTFFPGDEGDQTFRFTLLAPEHGGWFRDLLVAVAP